MATPAPKAPRVDIRISEEMDAWLIREATKRDLKNKGAFVLQILEALFANPETLGIIPEATGDATETPTEEPEPSKAELEAMRRLQVTLELFFKQHLASHPARTDLTDEDEEALEERWANIGTFIDVELAK